MRILVCGGRDFNDVRLFNSTMDKYKNIENLTIIQGNAKGADNLAYWWALENASHEEHYQADWDKFGKSAGYIRNKQMLEEGKPDLVIAFPGGKGTANMVKLAKERGIEVIEVNGRVHSEQGVD